MNDEQFEQFIKLLDAALVSDDKKIKSALRKFMFIMALNLSDDDCEPGPFTKMMETMDNLQRRLAQVEGQNTTWTETTPYNVPYVGGGAGTGTAAPYWIPGSTTGGSITFTNNPTSTTSGTITTSSSSCTGFTAPNTTTLTSYDLGIDYDIGTTIKEDIKDKLKKLVTAA